MAVHPHVCGVYAGDHIGLTEVGRFIPTYVGFTKKALRRCTYTAVHPHVCGVYVERLTGVGVYHGSSPRIDVYKRQEVSGVQIQVYGGADEATLQAILQAAKSC